MLRSLTGLYSEFCVAPSYSKFAKSEIFHTFPVNYLTDIKLTGLYTETSFSVLALAFLLKRAYHQHQPDRV
jgi:hypothetical protein